MNLIIDKEKRREKWDLEHKDSEYTRAKNIYHKKQVPLSTYISLLDLEERKKNKVIKKLSKKTSDIIDLVKEGIKLRDIAKRAGVTHQRVSQIAIKYGLRRHFNNGKNIFVGCRACGEKILTKDYFLKRRKNFYCNKECKKLFSKQRKLTLIENNKYTCSKCRKKFKYILNNSNEYTFKCRKCVREIAKAYRMTPQGKINVYNIIKNQNKKYPEKLKARTILNQSVALGKIIKPKKCSACGKKKKLDGHHSDYSKPLEVLWLCRFCHLTLHKKIKCN